MTGQSRLSSLSWELRWRYSLLREYCFYFRNCLNWRAVIRARGAGTKLREFVLRSGQVITFEGLPPFIVFREIWDQRVYLRAGRNLPFQHKQVHTIVDIGANIGLFSLFAAKWFPQAAIYAYEPAPENFEVLTENLHRNPEARIKAFPVAVTSARGEATLFLKSEAGWHSVVSAENSVNRVSVDTVDLEAVIENCLNSRIDFLKMDCEGAEYEILKGKSRLLSEQVRQVAMEYHETEDHKVTELESLFEAAGFDCQIYPQPEWQTGILVAQNRMLVSRLRP